MLLLAAVLAPAAAASGGHGGCLTVFDENLAAGERPSGVHVVAPSEGDDPSRVLFACQGNRISGLTLRLSPGQSAQVRLVLERIPEQAVSLGLENGLPNDWVSTVLDQLDPDTALVTLSIAAPAGAVEGKRYSDRLLLAPVGTDGPQTTIPVTLEIVESRPLFRDEFDVDPVIGQFSMAHDALDASFPSSPGHKG